MFEEVGLIVWVQVVVAGAVRLNHHLTPKHFDFDFSFYPNHPNHSSLSLANLIHSIRQFNLLVNPLGYQYWCYRWCYLLYLNLANYFPHHLYYY